MVDEIRKRLERTPFIPFSVRTSAGHEYSVPTIDHAHIAPGGNRVVVFDDQGTSAILRTLHINSVVEKNGE